MRSGRNNLRSNCKLKVACRKKLRICNERIVNIQRKAFNRLVRRRFTVNIEYTLLMFSVQRIQQVNDCKRLVLVQHNVTAYVSSVSCLIKSRKFNIIRAVFKQRKVKRLCNNPFKLKIDALHTPRN